MADEHKIPIVDPKVVLAAAPVIIGYEILKALIAAGSLSPQQAAQALTKASDHVRTGSEDDPIAGMGEAVARACEFYASFLLKQPGPSPGPDRETGL